MDRTVNNPEAEDENAEHDVVQRQVIGQTDGPQERAARHRLQAIFTAGKRRLQAEEVKHL